MRDCGILGKVSLEKVNMTEDRTAYKTYWTVKELAKAAGVTPYYIRTLIKAGEIQAEKPVRDWFIASSEAKRWLSLRKGHKEE